MKRFILFVFLFFLGGCEDSPPPLYEYPLPFEFQMSFEQDLSDPDFEISKAVNASIYFHEGYHGEPDAKDLRVGALVNAVNWLYNKFPKAETFYVSIKMGVGNNPTEFANHIFGSATFHVKGDLKTDYFRRDRYWRVLVYPYPFSKREIEMRVFYDTRYDKSGDYKLTKSETLRRMSVAFPKLSLKGIEIPAHQTVDLERYKEFKIKNAS